VFAHEIMSSEIIKVDFLVDKFKQAMTQARNEALEEAAKESDYFANNSITAKNISKNIRALKGKP
jgi:uncharacterized protein YggE